MNNLAGKVGANSIFTPQCQNEQRALIERQLRFAMPNACKTVQAKGGEL